MLNLNLTPSSFDIHPSLPHNSSEHLSIILSRKASHHDSDALCVLARLQSPSNVFPFNKIILKSPLTSLSQPEIKRAVGMTLITVETVHAAVLIVILLIAGGAASLL